MARDQALVRMYLELVGVVVVMEHWVVAVLDEERSGPWSPSTRSWTRRSWNTDIIST
jgi:hypothetical protein